MLQYSLGLSMFVGVRQSYHWDVVKGNLYSWVNSFIVLLVSSFFFSEFQSI